MAILAKECPLCGGKMMPPRCASYLTTVDDPGLPIMERHMKVLIYTCETCRYVAMFAPPSPLEEFEKRQAEEQAITDPVERFITCRRRRRRPSSCCTADGMGNRTQKVTVKAIRRRRMRRKIIALLPRCSASLNLKRS